MLFASFLENQHSKLSMWNSVAACAATKPAAALQSENWNVLGAAEGTTWRAQRYRAEKTGIAQECTAGRVLQGWRVLYPVSSLRAIWLWHLVRSRLWSLSLMPCFLHCVFRGWGDRKGQSPSRETFCGQAPKRQRLSLSKAWHLLHVCCRLKHMMGPRKKGLSYLSRCPDPYYIIGTKAVCILLLAARNGAGLVASQKFVFHEAVL